MPMLSVADVSRVAAALDSQRLELILLPTERCNFRCTYCYEDFVVGKMSNHVVAAVKSLIDRRSPELRSLTISWFGGEPLVARDVVLDISRFAARKAEAIPELEYRGSITTNGYLLDERLFRDLIAAGVNDFQISLDGPAAVHDATRRLAGGGPTFDRIWTNLVALHRTAVDFRVRLRIHVQQSNVNDLGPLIELLRTTVATDTRFSIFFRPVERFGGARDEEIEPIPEDRRHDVLAQLHRSLYGDVASRQEPEGYICYAARPTSLLIRADGRIGKCTVALRDNRNTVGSLLPDGTLTIDQARLRPWLRGYQNLDAAALACPLAGLPST